MIFEQLDTQIETVHNELQHYAVRQVNNSLTMRNILIGHYIVEYEQNGLDRANYGANTIKLLSERLKHIKGISNTQLYRFRDLYNNYPLIFSTVSGILEKLQLPSKTELENFISRELNQFKNKEE